MEFVAKKKKEKKSKHKKEHKDKKRKRRHSSREEDEVRHQAPQQPFGGLKITFKLGGIKTASTSVSPTKEHSPPPIINTPAKKKRNNRAEEDEWLEALEDGNLDERGEVPNKQLAPLTARQLSVQSEIARSEVERAAKAAAQDVWLAPETEEDVAKKQEASRKRKLVSDKIREEEKLETIQKLLQKQTSSRLRKDEIRRQHLEQNTSKAIQMGDVHFCRYVENKTTRSFSTPVGMDFPLKQSTIPTYPHEREKCSVQGCDNLRRYADSKSGRPLCSLRCYKQIHQQQESIPTS